MALLHRKEHLIERERERERERKREIDGFIKGARWKFI
jgi:hypothetical protein